MDGLAKGEQVQVAKGRGELGGALAHARWERVQGGAGRVRSEHVLARRARAGLESKVWKGRGGLC